MCLSSLISMYADSPCRSLIPHGIPNGVPPRCSPVAFPHHRGILSSTLAFSQMNMDYSFCQAVNLTAKDIPTILLLYDIACQYTIHLRDRVNRSPFISLPQSLNIVAGVGVWHVHGHVKECFARYYPGFIPHTGHVDGEILETLWSHLNLISGSARGMSASHRREVLDDHMSDSNWKKLTGISQSIPFCCPHPSLKLQC